jgi:hypothetical protein
MSVVEPQSAQSVLMVRPAGFGFNPQTAATNAFQQPPRSDRCAGAAVLREFDAAVELLRRAGVEVIVADDTASPVKPDAIFPNNWVSFHADGTVVWYPMLAVNRRWERREELIAQVAREGSFHISRTVDLSHHETAGHYLEGTGSLVLDRVSPTHVYPRAPIWTRSGTSRSNWITNCWPSRRPTRRARRSITRTS